MAERNRRRRRFQRTLTPAQARRAIYYDFEGRKVEGLPPMLLGACWLADPEDATSLEFRQYIVEPRLRDLERLDRGPVFLPLGNAVDVLIELSNAGSRHLVSWSVHDAEVIREFTGHTAFRHRNGIATAERWRRGRTSLGPGCPNAQFDSGNRLQSYLELIGYEVPPHVREGAGRWMATIERRMEGAGGDSARLSPGGKRAWTNLVSHNRHDVLGMREVIGVAAGLGQPPCRSG